LFRAFYSKSLTPQKYHGSRFELKDWPFFLSFAFHDPNALDFKWVNMGTFTFGVPKKGK
jgi:hypothetical protein